MIQEDFLHYLWKTKQFDLSDLKSTTLKPLQIRHFGIHNHNAGPDFLNACIQIGKTIWHGNVEMHLMASDWLKHNHQHDAAYSNVILHVVFKEDISIKRPDGTVIPCLELKHRIPGGISKRYLKLKTTQSWIPCQKLIHKIDPSLTTLWFEKLLVLRLEHKTIYFNQILDKQDGRWDETFYIALCRSFGASVNMDAFEALASSIPLQLVQRHRDNPLQIEALLFGQAGMLNFKPKDPFTKLLIREYQFLKQKYQLKSIPLTYWKFLRMRPSNFPTVRIAQLAQVLSNHSFIHRSFQDLEDYEEIKTMLVKEPSQYWLDHYRFNEVSGTKIKRIGKQFLDTLIINTIIPMLFLYGKVKDNASMRLKAIQLISKISAEKNSILRGWNDLGFEANNAAQSQALIHLKKAYCDEKKCLSCEIGHYIMKIEASEP